MGKKIKLILFTVTFLMLITSILSSCTKKPPPEPLPDDKGIERIETKNPDPKHLIKTEEVPDRGQTMTIEPDIEIPEPDIIRTPVKVLENEDAEWQRTVESGELLRALSAINIRVASLRPIKLVKGEDTAPKISIGGRLVDLTLLAEQLKLPSDLVSRISQDGELIFYGRGEYKILENPAQKSDK